MTQKAVIIMMKRTLLCLLLICALLLCACGRTEETVTTEPTTAPPTTAAPTTKAPEPETVISYDFRLKELPDIGKHQAKQAAYFYDAPLQEFKTSDRYGTLIPYRFSDNQSGYSSIRKYGFMTTDGKIVTAPIYENIYEQELDEGKTVYFTTKKVTDETPEKIPDWEEDEKGAQEAYERAEEFFYDNVRYQLISADGKHCLTLRTEPRSFQDPYSGAALIYCVQYRGEDFYSSQGLNSFLIYDTDCRLLADVSHDLREYDYAWIMAADENSFVVRGERNTEETGVSNCDLLFFEDGELDYTLEMGQEYPYQIEGDFIICSQRIYNKNGRTVYEFGEDNYAEAYDPDDGCLFLFHPAKKQLVKLDRQGDVLASAKADLTVEYTNLSLYKADGKTSVVLPYGNSYSNRGYRVYDSSLRLVCEISNSETHMTDFCREYDDESAPGVFLVGKDGKTDVLDIDGNVVATVPFLFDGYSLNNGAGNTDLIYLYLENGVSAVCSAKDQTVGIIHFDGKAPSYPDYFSKKLLVYSEDIGGIDSYDWRYVILDCETEQRLADNITVFNTFTVNGKTWFNYIKNGTLYVCDEDLNVIAAMYDNILV